MFQTARPIGSGGWGGPARGDTSASFTALPAGRDCYVVVPPIAFSIPIIGQGVNSPGLTICVQWIRVTARIGSIDIWTALVALLVGGIIASIWALIRRG